MYYTPTSLFKETLCRLGVRVCILARPSLLDSIPEIISHLDPRCIVNNISISSLSNYIHSSFLTLTLSLFVFCCVYHILCVHHILRKKLRQPQKSILITHSPHHRTHVNLNGPNTGIFIRLGILPIRIQ